MKGNEARLIEFMDGSKKRFIVPVYQRNYDWRLENCKQLYDDLIKVIKNRRSSHFFGSIVSVYSPAGRYNEFLIIDGQQRLTTVSLLLLAMYKLISNKTITNVSSTLGQQIYEDFLIDKYEPDQTRMKLKPIKNDQTAFGKLFEDDTEFVAHSNLTINYQYFYDRIQKAEISIDDLFDAIRSLQIIDIKLVAGDDNPQLVFESLNSTGLALSEGDKIRNLVLMDLPAKKQEQYYNHYWNNIEACTAYDVSAFIRDYLSVKLLRTPPVSKVYFAFKNYIEETGIEVELLLDELLSYAKLYEILIRGKTSNKKLNDCIVRLNRLETTVTRPFFLEILRLWKEKVFSDNDICEIFIITESYLFRRTICDLPTNVLNKVFLTLHKEILRDDGKSNYLEKMKYVLRSKKERSRFPDDNEFAEAVGTKPIYSMNSKNKVYLMERFENFGTIESKNIWEHIDCGDYSIEHIMPQHLTPAWRQSLGDDCDHIHEVWLHRLANLTLTAYNSKYSDRPFPEKRDIKNGFRESGLKMNQYIAQKKTWTLTELEERSEYMKQRALQIWALPVSSFTPSTPQLDSCTLDDETELTGRDISHFSYKDTTMPVQSWAEMYQKVLMILHSEDRSILTRLARAEAENGDLSFCVTNQVQDSRKWLDIDDNIHVLVNTSTQYKISLLRKFFNLYEADPSDLVFYLKSTDVQEGNISENRYEKRMEYWKFFIDYEKNRYPDDTIFCNLKPSKDNWIAKNIGVSGSQISCVGNFASARVELVLNHTRKEINKNIFDFLKTKKLEIESELNTNLEWERCDSNRLSKIYLQLNDVSIGNKSDWQSIAEFHASWSQRFRDVFLPYLNRTDEQ